MYKELCDPENGVMEKSGIRQIHVIFQMIFEFLASKIWLIKVFTEAFLWRKWREAIENLEKLNFECTMDFATEENVVMG